MYDSRIGHWLSEDPIGFDARDPNLRRYVANDPVDFVDPTGLKKDGGGQNRPAPRPLPTKPPPEMRPGDLLVIVIVDDPIPRDRDTPGRTEGDDPSPGHVSIGFGVIENGELRIIRRGWYPVDLTVYSRMYQHYRRTGEIPSEVQPVGGRVDNDGARGEDRVPAPYTNYYMYIVRQNAAGQQPPSLDELTDQMYDYPDNHRYDPDDCNCAHFVLDMMRAAGGFPMDPNFGQIRFGGQTFPTANAIGEDIRSERGMDERYNGGDVRIIEFRDPRGTGVIGRTVPAE